MDRFERLATAVAGGMPDRIPVSLWFHFGSEHLAPDAVADLHARFWRAFRWDFLKVMFDYRLDLPAAFDDGPDPDLEALLAETDWDAPFARQRACIAALVRDLAGEVPIVDTVYSPWMYLVRHVGYDRRNLLLHRPDLVAAILDRLAAAIFAHVDALAAMGIHGIYFATLAGTALPGSGEIALQSAHDRAVLQRASDLVRFLHLHGGSPSAEVALYPREVLHRDRGHGSGHGLAELRAAGETAIMGGLPHDSLSGLSVPAIGRRIAEAIVGAGRAGFILAPGCSVSPSLASRTMHAIRDSALLDNPAAAVRERA